MVDLRLPQPGAARLGQAIRALRQAARRARRTTPTRPLRELVRPYILRRLKTDKSIIADLPDKTEVKAFCPLVAQAGGALSAGRRGLAEQLEQADGMQRAGLVLAS